MKTKLGLATFAMLLLLAACGKDDETPVTGMEILNSTDRKSLVGRQVDLVDVRVTDVPGDVLFWVGGTGGSLPVVLEGELHDESGEGDITIRRDQIVNVKGTVRLVEGTPDSDKMWGLIDAGERRAIHNAVVYIGATQVQVK